VLVGLVLALTAAGCGDVGTPTALVSRPLTIQRSPSPFSQVTAGEVSALIPDDWQAVASGEDVHEGFFASPEPNAWARMDGSVAWLSATWIDATLVGMPSDLYYMVATGPALESLTHSPGCRAISQRVIADHRPAYLTGTESVGDYIAQGEGTCTVRGVPTRWAYFVAAPGFGPAREVGIPASGLYVVVAVLPDSRRASGMLRRLVRGTTFGGAGVRDFIAAAHGATAG
jgi:predicted RecA/RadA family phage recombinase